MKIADIFRGETWAMEPRRFEAFVAELETIEAKGPQDPKPTGPAPLDIRDGVAHIPISGVILKSVHPILKAFGVRATGTTDTREAIARAIEDEDVSSIVLDIDSPGGTVSGVAELADDVKAATEFKPVHAHAEDIAASAAYWIASQATQISASKTTQVGSIGVYTVLGDYSEMAEKAGVKVHVVSTGELKGTGVPGSKITDAQLADIQRNVDEIGKLFNSAVAHGRDFGPKKVAKVATGQVWLADESQKLGLIDKVQTAQQAHKELAAAPDAPEPQENPDPPPTGEQEDPTMAENASGPVATSADNDELKAKLQRAEEQTKKAEKATRDTMIGQYADRVTADNRQAVEEFGAFCGADFDKFAAHLKALPQITRPTPEGDAQVNVIEDEDGDYADAGWQQLSGSMNLSLADVKAFENVKAATYDGRYLMNDGSIKTREELTK